VAAFRATLEEVVEADLLLHVIDISHPRMSEQSIAVYDVLRQLKAEDKSIVSVLNKADRIDSPPVIERLLREYPNSVAISALKNAGVDTLLAQIEQHITRDSQVVIFHIPYQEGGIATQLREIGRIVDQKYLADVIEVVAEFNDQQYRKYQQFIVNMSEGVE
jgi:GTP-binding protein HflX